MVRSNQIVKNHYQCKYCGIDVYIPKDQDIQDQYVVNVFCPKCSIKKHKRKMHLIIIDYKGGTKQNGNNEGRSTGL